MMTHLEKLMGESEFAKWLVLLVLSILISGLFKLVIKLFTNRLRKLSEKTATRWDDIVVGAIDKFQHWVLFVWVFYFSTRALSRQTAFEKPFQVILALSFVFQFISWGQYLLLAWKGQVLEKKIAENPSASAALGLLYRVVQGVLVVVVVLMGLSNVGVDIGALLAGLGVGGVAVALAAQNILGDLLASLSIVLDKPFVIGDFIVSGEVKGTIENIGIKTTRLRSLSGEQIIISNKDLLESRVQNYQRMTERRVVKQIGVVYSTPAEKLEKIPLWTKEIIERQEKARFDRCHFANFGASSLDFELVFYVGESDYTVYMNIQERIILEIFKKFSAEGVDFAFPTQSLFIEKIPKTSS